jgi:phosphatidate phosphatase PAH1
MEDYKVLIYIVLSILYFLFKGRGKKKKPVTRKNTDSQQAEQKQSEQRRPKSFEELLAELSGENSDDKTRDGGDILTESKEIKSLSDQVEERPMHQEVSREEYENADETLKELYKKGEKLKSIDELVDIEEVSVQSNRFQEFEDSEEDNSFAKEIREGLSNPESAKKAIVYAEIFNRKY